MSFYEFLSQEVSTPVVVLLCLLSFFIPFLSF